MRVRGGADASRGEQCIHCHPDGETPELRVHLENGGARELRFDSVHGSGVDQRAFFHRSGFTNLLDAALDGYTATVFAFGQTGSGKTFTMSGAPGGAPGGGRDETMDGLMQRAAAYIYNGVKARPNTPFCHMWRPHSSHVSKKACLLSRRGPTSSTL